MNSTKRITAVLLILSIMLAVGAIIISLSWSHLKITNSSASYKNESGSGLPAGGVYIGVQPYQPKEEVNLTP